jgi:hypothetical protein
VTTERFSNSASTALASSIGAGDLSITVQGTTHFPTQPEFRIRVGQELMLVTGVAGVVYTVTRGIESTSASSHAAGTAVVAVLTAGALDELRAEIEAEDRTASGIRTASTVVAVSAATAPTPGQVLTATSGTAANWQTIPTPPTITDHGGAAAGDVVRRVSEGVLAKAQADSVPHATYVIGIWDGTQVIPFSSQPIVTFDSAPANGPCYLSSTLAGALTSTPPASGAVSVPSDLVIIQDYSVGSSYRARVGHSASIVSPLGIEQQFIADAAALIGVLPNSLHSKFDDFNTLPTTGYPTFGAISYAISPGTHLNTTGAPSTLDFSATDGNYPEWTVQLGAPSTPTDLNLLSNVALTSQLWAFRIRFKVARLNETFKFYIDRGAGGETIGLGMVIVSAVNSFYAIYGNFSPLAVDPSPSQRQLLIAEDVAWHVFTMWSIGDGSMRVRLDNGTTYTLSLPAISAISPRFTMVTTNAIFDYWMLAAV